MIKLTSLLTEYNFKVTPDNIYQWEVLNNDYTRYTFTTDATPDNPNGTKYNVLFEEQDEGLYERIYQPVTGGIFQMTGEGKAFKINATVMAITLDFLEKNEDWLTLMIVPINFKRYKLVKLFLDANIPKNYFVEEEDGVFIINRKPYM